MNKLIIANWKSHKNVKEAEEWIVEYATSHLSLVTGQVTVVLCPAFPLLSAVQAAIQSNKANLSLGIQTLSPYPAGSYTGGVSTKNLEGVPIRYAILGHSERRRYFHETNNDVSKQVEQAHSVGIIPIVCLDKDYITSQAAAITDEVKTKCVIAYEPASAIGLGQEEDHTVIAEVIEQIRKEFADSPILYGGSVDASNAPELAEICDGFIVGTASLESQTFIDLVQALI